ncbi:WD repeat-containing protein 3-like [Lingula anatina]|uniref:WD repeat-containing protein 3-like n=1 Tax=Lingula anatina TaxID=7574 RepID=A0A2R2MNM1_LINAN|nr:WD repeat-containing protein 3-like [Lingula anatina]|eukprot:XP_023931815.1 WD repeat-containing protein 3-like [Lingula anatina]
MDQGNENTLEVFKLVSEEEIEKHLHKKQKRARKRARETGQEGLSENVTRTVEDEIQRLSPTKLSSKIRSFDCIVDSAEIAKIVCHLSNNTLELQSLNIKEKKPVAECVTKLSSAGHRSDVRSVCFSSDNTAVLSTSGETMKVWNRTTQQCIRTIDCEYGLCSMFAPGDRHAIIGTKSGKLQIFDIASGSLLENVEAHLGAVWSVCMSPDKRGIISGSADKEVKFWDFELITDEKYSKTSKRLTLVHTRTLKMSEEVLCVKYSPDQRLVAVSLLDSTVKVFFADTLKFFLSLYGHKLPVTCMDISSDSSLLVTGSADRNVKLWGLDFGDCHKSIFAHDDSIMCVQFVTKTHMFFTGGKDKKLKEWDGDNFEHIQTLEGHHAEIWCLAVSPNGKHVVTGAHDKSLRIWEKTEEPLVLEEEKEMEREKEYEEAIADGEEPVVPGEADSEVGMAGKKTVETVKSAEKLMEAVEVYREETAKYKDHEAECKRTGKELPPPQLHPLFQAYGVSTPAKYVLEIIRRIKSSELEESLLVLPFSYIPDLLGLLSMFIDNGWEVELTCRCLLLLLRIHHGQITSNQVMVPVIEKLKTNTSSKVGELKDIIGFNMAGLQFLKQQMEQKEELKFFADATDRFSQKKKKQKSKAVLAFKT